jgi:hypothetical protein
VDINRRIAIAQPEAVVVGFAVTQTVKLHHGLAGGTKSAMAADPLGAGD